MTFTPITLYFLYFIFSRPQSELCTPENRIDTCKEEEYNPVCALYTGNDCNSPTGFCYRTLLRTCDACLDSDILGYTPGECEEPTFPQICTKDQEAPVSHNDETEPVCGYSKHSRLERLRGQTSIARPFASGSDACGSEQIAFHVRGECKRPNEVGICKYHKNDKGCSSDDNSEPFCAYYTGEDCNEKLCRKTVTVDSCNVCGDASVLFYVKGSCEFVEAASEDVEELILDNEPGQQEIPVPELEAVFQDDGTYVYEEVKPEKEEIDDVEPQDYIPELEAVVQEDGTTVYELAPETVETTQEQVEIIPELAAVLQEDGTYVYEEVKPEKEEIDDVEKQDFIPELEAVVQVDGSVVYEEVKNSQEQEEAVEVDCAYQTQEEIPELTVPEDGVVLCVEVVTPTEEVFPVAQNEEASVVLSNNEESQADEPQQIEAIQTRLLVEPDN